MIAGCDTYSQVRVQRYDKFSKAPNKVLKLLRKSWGYQIKDVSLQSECPTTWPRPYRGENGQKHYKTLLDTVQSRRKTAVVKSFSSLSLSKKSSTSMAETFLMGCPPALSRREIAYIFQ